MRIAVTGASGRIGGQVVRLLAAPAEHEVVALARRPVQWRDQAVSAAIADYEDRPALRAALSGADTLVLVSSDGPAVRVLRHHQNVIEAAAAGGVRHIVALSGLDADLDSPFCYAVSYGYTERLLAESGCGVSVARASIFAEFFLGLLAPARATGEIRLPAGDGRISLVSRADVARSLAALAVAEPSGCHDITGPEALDLAAVAALATDASGRPVRYSSLTPAQYRVELARADEDPWWVYAYSTMFDSIREQRWARVSDEVRRLTGRLPARPADSVQGRRVAPIALPGGLRISRGSGR
jgi:NAD(P)H dehydrogenase (quinone)